MIIFIVTILGEYAQRIRNSKYKKDISIHDAGVDIYHANNFDMNKLSNINVCLMEQVIDNN